MNLPILSILVIQLLETLRTLSFCRGSRFRISSIGGVKHIIFRFNILFVTCKKNAPTNVIYVCDTVIGDVEDVEFL